jgi:hypothetical protein
VAYIVVLIVRVIISHDHFGVKYLFIVIRLVIANVAIIIAISHNRY